MSTTYKLHIATFGNLQVAVPVCGTVDWSALVADLSQHRILDNKEDGKLFSLVRYRDGAKRGNDGVLEIYAYVADVDNGTKPDVLWDGWDEMELEYFLFSSYSNTAEHPRWRVIFPLSQPVPVAEWADCWARCSTTLMRNLNDHRAKDPARIYFVPSCPQERLAEAFTYHQADGFFLDWKALPPVATEKPKKNLTKREKNDGFLSDADVLEKARSSKSADRFSALFAGDMSAYGNDHSRADAALCEMLAFWCGRGGYDQIERLFRQSGLYRDKWDREDYRQRTIEYALSQCQEFYSPSEPTGILSLDDTPGKKAEKTYPLTELGNAERLVAEHGDDLRYCDAMGWLAYTGVYWEVDVSGEVTRRMIKTVRAIQASARKLEKEAANAKDDETKKRMLDKAQKTRQWGFSCETNGRIESSIKLARSLPGVYVSNESLDKDHFKLNVLNGTLDLTTGKLHPHERADLITKCCRVAYQKGATAPEFDKFLSRIQPDPDLRGYIQRAMGYSLTGDVSQQCFYFCWGDGSNGKSTLLNLILQMVAGYGIQAPPDMLLQSATERVRDDLAALQGKRYVITIEVAKGQTLAEGVVKQLTGGDNIRARFLYKNSMEFAPSWKIWLAANHRPVVTSNDHGIWRRVKLIPFTQKIAECEKDYELPAKLQRELPGILNWCLAGLEDYLAWGMQEPKAVSLITEEYRQESDWLGQFLGEKCYEGANAKVPATQLYDAYVAWSERRKERVRSMTTFGRDMGMRAQRIKVNGVYWYSGYSLLDEKRT